MKRVAIVVLDWDGWQGTLACERPLQAFIYGNFEMVVDNGSTDGSITRIARALHAVTLRRTGANLGFGGGCYIGIRNAWARSAGYVGLINSNVIVNLWLERSNHSVQPGAICFIACASAPFRRAGLEQVGMFDAVSFFVYGEDTNLGFLSVQAGSQSATAWGWATLCHTSTQCDSACTSCAATSPSHSFLSVL